MRSRGERDVRMAMGLDLVIHETSGKAFTSRRSWSQRMMEKVGLNDGFREHGYGTRARAAAF